MIYIVTAIFSEAKALIEHFGLQKVQTKPFLIFSNDNISLVVSGMGKVESAIATTYMCKDKKIDKLINIGVCGTNNKNKEIGSLYKIKSVIDVSSDKKYMISADGEALYCFDRIVKSSENIKNNILIDMESVGFYKAAVKFVKKEDIRIYKIVSDHLKTSHISLEDIYTITKNAIKEIDL